MDSYRGAIEHTLPEDWHVELWPAGNKDAVISLFEQFDWGRFEPTRITFFLDRDLSDFLGDKLPESDDNVYITDGYSIENDIVSRNTCDRVLNEVCGLDQQPEVERDSVLDLFDEQHAIFQESLVPVMAWIIHWRRSGEKPCLNDIYMKHLFTLSAGTVQTNPDPKGHPDWVSYIHGQCNISKGVKSVTKVETEFRAAAGATHFIRGKYELWFLIAFCLSVHRDIASLSATFKASPKMRTSLGHGNAITLVAPRARVPSSLKEFLRRTHGAYAAQHGAVA